MRLRIWTANKIIHEPSGGTNESMPINDESNFGMTDPQRAMDTIVEQGGKIMSVTVHPGLDKFGTFQTTIVYEDPERHLEECSVCGETGEHDDACERYGEENEL